MRIHRSKLYCAAFVVLAVTSTAFGHVRISPRESASGATQKYTMTVPTERQSPTIRIEATFPASVTVLSFEAMPGWKIEERKEYLLCASCHDPHSLLSRLVYSKS